MIYFSDSVINLEMQQMILVIDCMFFTVLKISNKLSVTSLSLNRISEEKARIRRMEQGRNQSRSQHLKCQKTILNFKQHWI